MQQPHNPLLNDNRAPIDYDSVTLEHVKSAFDTVIDNYEAGLRQVIDSQQAQPSWYGLVLAMDNVIADVQAVAYATLPLAYKGEPWRTVIWDNLARVQDLFRENRRNEPLHALYERLASNNRGLDVYERATLDKVLQEYRLAGVHLDETQLAKLQQLEDEILEHRYGFFETLEETIERSSVDITDEARLAGVPQHLRDLMAEEATKAGLTGWRILCNARHCNAILEFADDRGLRKEVYAAYHSRGAHEDPEKDNGNHLQQLALLREHKAQLIGGCSYPQLILQGKAAESVESVQQLLHTLAWKIRPAMLKARLEIQRLAQKHALGDAQPWDIKYLRAREQTMSSDALREYFTLDNAVQALADLAQRVFGLTFVPETSKWHDSVKSFSVRQGDEVAGYLYLDVVQYPGKGRVVHTTAVRHRRWDAHGRVHPASANMFSDGAPGQDGAPSLLDHLALRKLFHEFGHALHVLLMPATNHLLSDPNRAGSDSQEFYAKFLERWLWSAEYLVGISAHYQTGEPLTQVQAESVLADLRTAQLDRCALDLSMALFDLELHTSPDDGKSLQQRLLECRERCGCWPLASFEKPAHALDHLVSGYEAGYYSYIWGEVHAIDVFSHFEQWGLFDERAGKRFRAAFADWANAKSIPEGIQDFFERPMQADAFLRWYGLS
ncbi:peptidase M3 [Pseudomonas putida]|nr:peptidase M3 [Pseudomonas putida]